MRAFTVPIRSGVAGVFDTLRVMRWAALEAADNPAIQDTAARIVAGRAGPEAVEALAAFVCEVAYVDDPHPDELIRSPALIVERIEAGDAGGDCDDTATLTAALALALGWSARYRVVSAPPTGHHVWAEVAPPGFEWYEIDPQRPGGEPPASTFEREAIVPI